ncbi:hypothetical protein [Isoptericola haloaureus]|uniref:Vitamin K epoxide reductase family protein n=1 Tax=Isoptericola haloaureus TaxID=1542902 RepID=A0ABU7Z3K7_9MICO
MATPTEHPTERRTDAPPASARRRRPSARIVVVGALAAALLAAWYLTAGGVPDPVYGGLVLVSAALGGATLATYVPPSGSTWRSRLGCGPCDVAAAATVVVPPILLAPAPTATMALVAVAATGFGLFQRRDAAGASCPV